MIPTGFAPSGMSYLQSTDLPSYVRQTGRIVRGHVGEHQPFLVVVLAQDLVLAQVETVAHAKPADKLRRTCYVDGGKGTPVRTDR